MHFFHKILIVPVLSQPAVLAPIFIIFILLFHKIGDGEMKYEIMSVSQTHNVIKQITFWDAVDLFQK